MKRWDRRNCCFSAKRGKSMQELDMRDCFANGKTEIGFFRLEKRRCQPRRLRHTRSVNRMLLLVIWTEFQGENRPIWCFHLLFHPSFHLAATAKYPHSSQLACGSAAFGNGRGAGNGRWRPPFLTATAVPVPFGFRSASPSSRVATARFPIVTREYICITPRNTRST